MFSRNKGSQDDSIFDAVDTSKRRGGNASGSFSIIGADVVITGNLSAEVDLHIDGKIEGDVRCASLVQGPDSAIHGVVQADSARLAGRIDGSIEAGELVIEASARINGDVVYDKLTIEPGGQVQGQFRHRGAHAQGRHDGKPLELVAQSGE